MRINFIVTAAVATALFASFAAVAQTSYEPARTAIVPGERIYVQPANQPFGPYHGGYVTLRDQQSLSDAIGALAVAPDMNGVIVTMVFNNGQVAVDGMASASQGPRIENILRHVAGVTRVTSWFSASGA